MFLKISRHPGLPDTAQSSAVIDSEITFTWTPDRSNLAGFLRSDFGASISADDVLRMIPKFNGFRLSFLTLKDQSPMVSTRSSPIIILIHPFSYRLSILAE